MFYYSGIAEAAQQQGGFIVTDTPFASGFGTSLTQAFPHVPVGDSVIVVCELEVGSSPLLTFTDNQSNVYTLDHSFIGEFGEHNSFFYRLQNVVNQPSSLSATWTSNGTLSGHIFVVRGLAANPVDVVANDTADQGGNPATLAFTTTQDNCAAFAFLHTTNGHNVTAVSAGWVSADPDGRYDRVLYSPNVGVAEPKTLSVTGNSMGTHRTGVVAYRLESGETYDKVLQTDATGDYLSRSASVLNNNAPYTMFGRFKIDTDRDGYGHFFHVGGTYAFDGRTDFVGVDTDGTNLRMGAAGGGAGSYPTIGPQLPIGSWFWLALVRESVTSLKVYYGTNGSDGILAGTITDTVVGREAATLMTVMDYNSAPILGRAAHVRLWDAALSLSELHTEFASQIPVKQTNLWSYTQLSGATVADAIQDRSANDRDWTAVGTMALVDADFTEPITSITPTSDVSTTGWVAVPGPTFYSAIDEDVASDTDYVISPLLNTGSPIIMGLPVTYNPGVYNITIRGQKDVGVTGQIRVSLLNASNTVQGSSAWQSLTDSYATYTLPTVAMDTFSRISIEYQA